MGTPDEFRYGEIPKEVYNLLEVAYYSTNKKVTLESLKNISNKPNFFHDKNGDGYYDVISAFQKSIRGSDVDAALHYLARLIEAEDLDIIFRRMSVIAYEDIGLANPNMGVKVNDSAMIYLHSDINNTYKQYYTENTNILNTEILNTYFNLKVLQTDFVCNDKNILVRKYKIKLSGSNSRKKHALLRQQKVPYSVLFFDYGVVQFCQKDKKKEEIL